MSLITSIYCVMTKNGKKGLQSLVEWITCTLKQDRTLQWLVWLLQALQILQVVLAAGRGVWTASEQRNLEQGLEGGGLGFL